MGLRFDQLPSAITNTSADIIPVMQAGVTRQNTIGNLLSASFGSSQIGFLQSGAGAVARTVQAKERDVVSVKDFGAVGDGVTDDAAKFTLAAAASKEIHAFQGTYLLPSTPTLSNNVLEVHSDATLTGAGGAALGYTSGAKEQSLQWGTTGADFATKYIRRNATHVGGTPGVVATGLRVDDYVSAGVANYEWSIVGTVTNNSTTQAVGIYGQGNKPGGTNLTWGMVAELRETSAINDPTGGSIGLEVDNRSNGTDANNKRLGIDVVITRLVPGSGTATVCAYGIRIQNSGEGTNAIVGTGVYISANTTVGFDTSAAIITQAAYKMAQAQAIAFDAAAINQVAYDGTGIGYKVSGSTKLRLNADGSIALNGGVTVIPGTFSTGAATPTLGTNKPGAGGTPATWQDIVINGTAYIFPVWTKA